ncbi:cation:proton antiporter [candidate division CSSED10-310 bacterium]|uniref:Cation:proton antiporter n=1 Tax=candidate division CSSED10-310 bacterium TaxID=2855610 RepID=A0ABV6YXC1_UNCC1
MELLNDILIIFGLSTAVLFLCSYIHLPAIVGFLLTGVLAGPHGFGLIQSVHEVEVLAEVGVILLLFTIGIEFSFKDLVRIKRSVLIGGSLQILLTILVVFLISNMFGQPPGNSIFFGFLAALSSTAIVLKFMQDRADIESPHGQNSLAILIFQDIAIVPMMLFTPFLAGIADKPGNALLFLAVKGILIIFLVFVSAKWIVPFLFRLITRTRSRELFMLSIIVLCLAIAWSTSKAGLSLALGAFLAGLVISESEYSHQALANILPFRDVFTSFFFVSIGMLLNVSFVFTNLGQVTLMTGLLVLVKLITAIGAVLILGLPLRTAILVGFALCQIGEFSFVLSKVGIQHNLMPTDYYQLFLAVSVITMIFTPFFISFSPRFSEQVNRLPFPKMLKNGFSPFPNSTGKQPLSDHVIIIGFGLNGRNLAKAAKLSTIPYTIIEMNSETVRSEQKKGEPIQFGDATNEAILNHAYITKARIIVIAVSDLVATRAIVKLARSLNPKIHIIVRTRYYLEMERLYELGADGVVTEEFETSMEIFTRVLSKYLVPKEQIEQFIAEVRGAQYSVFRKMTKEAVSFCDLNIHLHNMEVRAFQIRSNFQFRGKSLSDIQPRRRYGVTILAIHRDAQTISNPDGGEQLFKGDIIVVLGQPQQIATIAPLFVHS